LFKGTIGISPSGLSRSPPFIHFHMTDDMLPPSMIIGVVSQFSYFAPFLIGAIIEGFSEVVFRASTPGEQAALNKRIKRRTLQATGNGLISILCLDWPFILLL
jgi:hypothetical protein